MNAWVEQYLRGWTNARQDNWSMLLPLAEFAHNSWKHAKTQKTPHQMLFGMNPDLPITKEHSKVPSTQTHLEEITAARQHAQNLLQKHKDTPPPQELEIRQQVWLKARNLPVKTPSKKLAPLQYGPYKVTERISPVAYRIGLPSEMKVHNVFHVDLLTPYRSTSAYGPVDVQPPPELIEGEEEYKIKSIIKVQRRGPRCVLSYLVKWKGYPESENSWVKQHDLHAPELLKEFYRSAVAGRTNA
jgi:hypothetical protein